VLAQNTFWNPQSHHKNIFWYFVTTSGLRTDCFSKCYLMKPVTCVSNPYFKRDKQWI
jgi:hypothetical protein